MARYPSYGSTLGLRRMLIRMGIEPNGSLAGNDASAGGDKIESTSAVDHAAATKPKASDV